MGDEPPKTVDINWIKTSQFREIACDGIVGGPSAQNKLWLAFYNERFPLPRLVREKLIPTSVADEYLIAEGEGQPLESKSGIIRNLEVGVFLNKEVAIQLRDWLSKQIDLLEGKK